MESPFDPADEKTAIAAARMFQNLSGYRPTNFGFRSFKRYMDELEFPKELAVYALYEACGGDMASAYVTSIYPDNAWGYCPACMDMRPSDDGQTCLACGCEDVDLKRENA